MVKNSAAYNSALNWLESFIDFERQGLSGLRSPRYSLEHFSYFLERIGSPHKSLKLIHIAGTKGKGSTGSLLTSILTAAGYRTGFYSSPHIYNYRERIQIDGSWISEEEFAQIIRELQREWERLGSPDSRSFRTVFELLTAAGFIYFLHKRVDFAVIETGVGGRLDATNVISPILSIITPIGFDHKSLLGETLEEIAREKAGIIKAGIPVVVAPQLFPQATQVVKQKAADINSPISFAEESVKIVERIACGDKQRMRIYFNAETLDVETKMLGAHQARNIQTALTAVVTLQGGGIEIPDYAIINGIKNWFIPGRVELLSREPLIIVDGAHCPLSIQALLNTIQEIAGDLRCIFLMSIMADKEVLPILSLIRNYPGEVMLFSYPAPTPRALKPEKLAELAEFSGLTAKPFSEVAEAVNAADNLLKGGEFDALVCCGTFYSIAALRKLFRRLLSGKY